MLQGNSAANILTGGEGEDIIIGGAGDDILIGGAGNDVLDGGEGSDTASYIDADGGVTVDLGIAFGQDTGGADLDLLV